MNPGSRRLALALHLHLNEQADEMHVHPCVLAAVAPVIRRLENKSEGADERRLRSST